MQKNRNSSLGVLSGLVLGAVGIVGGLVLWKLIKGQEYSLGSADESVARAVKKLALQPKPIARQTKKQVKTSKVATILKQMRRGALYTQVQLEKITKIPYRSVRRYVDALIAQKKITSSGYGRGKVFRKV